MTTCAVIDNNNVLINVIVTKPTDLPPEGCTLIEIPEGFYWDGSQLKPIPIGMDDGN